MKKRTKLVLASPRSRGRPTRRTERKTKLHNPALALLAIFFFCLLGCLWVWKENWNERLSTRMLLLENRHRELKEQRDILLAGLADHSQFARIEAVARRELGMITPRISPDTIWCKEVTQEPLLGAMVFYNFKSKSR